MADKLWFGYSGEVSGWVYELLLLKVARHTEAFSCYLTG